MCIDAKRLYHVNIAKCCAWCNTARKLVSFSDGMVETAVEVGTNLVWHLYYKSFVYGCDVEYT